MSTLGRCLRSLGITVGLLLCVGIATSPASAAPVTFEFHGLVVEIGTNVVDSRYTFLSPLHGFYTFESTTSESGDSGNYPDAISVPSGLNFTLGTYSSTQSSDPPNQISVGNNTPLDSYHVESGITGGGPVNITTPRDPVSFEFTLTGPTSIFADNSLPATAPDVSSFIHGNAFRVTFEGGANSHVTGIITSLTTVPLPPAVLLFGAGLVALIGLGARNWQQRKTV
ncbi:MAG: hypothetical protein HZB34_02245 [Nitrospirae bacterium]|nr:hypothetical protein [Nitrospirota bacterium]